MKLNKRSAVLAAGAVGLVAVVIGGMTLFPADAPAQAKKLAPLALDGAASTTPWKRYSDWPQRDESKFNTLAKLASPPAPKAPRKLTAPLHGDAAKGEK